MITDKAAISNVEGNSQQMAPMFLGLHRWAWDRSIPAHAESVLVKRQPELFLVPANIKPNALARLGWPTRDITWESLGKMVEANSDQSALKWTGLPRSDPGTTRTFCAALFALAVAGSYDSIKSLVGIADHEATKSVYPFGVIGGELIERNTQRLQPVTAIMPLSGP